MGLKPKTLDREIVFVYAAAALGLVVGVCLQTNLLGFLIRKQNSILWLYYKRCLRLGHHDSTDQIPTLFHCQDDALQIFVTSAGRAYVYISVVLGGVNSFCLIYDYLHRLDA
ncbi:hypothetical protein ACFE04_031743 [Oxalis oulophora]